MQKLENFVSSYEKYILSFYLYGNTLIEYLLCYNMM